jgi:hypothetical protein
LLFYSDGYTNLQIIKMLWGTQKFLIIIHWLKISTEGWYLLI